MLHGVRPSSCFPSRCCSLPAVRSTEQRARGPGATAPGSREEATVTRVVDGDTIHVLLDGADTTIRFIGVDTPETVAPGQSIECYGPEASHSATARLTGGLVELEFDRDLIDPYERTLAYVWHDGRLFNETLVRRGFAEATAYPPNVAHQDELDAAESRRAPTGAACGESAESSGRGSDRLNGGQP